MKISELEGKPVIGMATARKAGVVADALVSPSHDAIAALVVKGAQRGPNRIIPVGSVRAIGPDAVTIEHSDLLRPPEQVPELAGLASLASVVGSRVLTPDGQVLGDVSEVTFDPSTYRVLSYEYRPGWLKGHLTVQHPIAPADIVGLGDGIVTIKQAPASSHAA
jgi:uncharacterized protein YrrD